VAAQIQDARAFFGNGRRGSRMSVLVGAMTGLLVSAAVLLWGLRVGDRWLAAAAGVALVIFLLAVARASGTL
jgi:hypothetical protein